MADLSPAFTCGLPFVGTVAPNRSPDRGDIAAAAVVRLALSGAGPARRKTMARAQAPLGQGGAPTPPVVIRYGMRGRDPDCLTLTYRSWVAVGEADYAGAQYAGARCGGTPLADVVVLWVGT
jgi:hypothetical protein